MIKILFVCHGNICRSPMAEFIFKKMIKEKGLEDRFEVNSVAASNDALGCDIYSPAKACLKEHNIPFDKRVARRITKSDVDYYDYIIAMEEYNIENIIKHVGNSNKYSLLLDYTDKPKNISDPWYTGDFETTYNEINYGCSCLLSKLMS